MAAIDDLFAAARAAQANAYAPYSRFKVGAALLTPSGRVFAGCNVENAAYPQGSCAEAGAIAAMALAGERTIAAVMVVGDGDALVTPVRRLPPAHPRVRRARHARPRRRAGRRPPLLHPRRTAARELRARPSRTSPEPPARDRRRQQHRLSGRARHRRPGRDRHRARDRPRPGRRRAGGRRHGALRRPRRLSAGGRVGPWRTARRRHLGGRARRRAAGARPLLRDGRRRRHAGAAGNPGAAGHAPPHPHQLGGIAPRRLVSGLAGADLGPHQLFRAEPADRHRRATTASSASPTPTTATCGRG